MPDGQRGLGLGGCNRLDEECRLADCTKDPALGLAGLDPVRSHPYALFELRMPFKNRLRLRWGARWAT